MIGIVLAKVLSAIPVGNYGPLLSIVGRSLLRQVSKRP